MTPPARVRRLTPAPAAALAIYRLDGDGIDDFLACCFRGPRRSTSRLAYGKLVDGDELVDEVVVARDGPAVEISVHGGLAVTRRVERLFVERGLAIDSSSVTLDPQFEGDALAPALARETAAALRVVRAPRSVLFLLAQAEGLLAREIAGLCEALDDAAVADAARVGVAERARSLLLRSAYGRGLVEPPRVVFTGVPNAGKSSLVNRLVNAERLIVAPIAGTTRDLVAVDAEIAGYPFVLVDSAGDRTGALDRVEIRGIERMHQARAHADLVVRLHPAVDGPAPRGDLRALVVASRADELDPPTRRQREAEGELLVSSRDGGGVESLAARLIFRSSHGSPCARELPCPFTRRQVDLLRRAEQVVMDDPAAAKSALVAVLRG